MSSLRYDDDQKKTHRVGLHLHQVVQDPSDRKVLEEEQKQNITVMSSDSIKTAGKNSNINERFSSLKS